MAANYLPVDSMAFRLLVAKWRLIFTTMLKSEIKQKVSYINPPYQI